MGSIGAIIFVYLFALLQNRRFRSHENIDRIRRAQGLALVLIPVLTAFRPKIEAAIIHESKPAPPDEIIHLLDQLYILGVAGGLILQMVAALQANQRSELAANANETARSSYNSIVRQRLSYALRYCDDAIGALLRLSGLLGQIPASLLLFPILIFFRQFPFSIRATEWWSRTINGQRNHVPR